MPNRNMRSVRARAQAQDGAFPPPNLKKAASRADPVSGRSAKRQERDYIRRLVQELVQSRPAMRLLQSTTANIPSIEEVPSKEAVDRSAMLVHELRQPLFTMSMASESLRLILENDDLDLVHMRQSVMRITEQVERAQAILDQMFATPDRRESAHERSDILFAARQAAHLLELEAVPDLELIWQMPEQQMLVAANPIELEQVFVNLLRNAKESIEDRRSAGWGGSGRIVITMEHRGGDAHCLITDNGAGLAPRAAASLFQPFFTTKGDTGTGLGLHICQQIVAQGKGSIDITPGIIEGAQVEIQMPSLAQHKAA